MRKYTKKETLMMGVDDTLKSLKKRYFGLLKQEDWPNTKLLTKTIDKIEQDIRDRIKELLT